MFLFSLIAPELMLPDEILWRWERIVNEELIKWGW
jgi:hypothetical protein